MSLPTASTTAPEPTVPSPCRSLCKLDADQVCTGCGRTLDDIRAWRTMPDAERRDCVTRAEARRQRWGDVA